MSADAKQVVTELLSGIRNPKVVKQLCSPDVTYVSFKLQQSGSLQDYALVRYGAGGRSDQQDLPESRSLLARG